MPTYPESDHLAYTAAMTRWLMFLALVVFSSGWVVPFYFSFQFLAGWCQLEAAPIVYGTEGGGNSFPFLAAAKSWWWITSIWLGLVALFWSVIGARRLLFTGTRA
jgi:hypothetical protein